MSWSRGKIATLDALSALISLALIALFVNIAITGDRLVENISGVCGVAVFVLGGVWFKGNETAQKFYDLAMHALLASFAMRGGWYAVVFGSMLAIMLVLNVALWRQRRGLRGVVRSLYGKGSGMDWVMPWDPRHFAYDRNRETYEDPTFPGHDKYISAKLDNNPDSFYVFGNGRVMGGPFDEFKGAADYIIKLKEMEHNPYGSYQFSVMMGDGRMIEEWNR